MYLQQSQSSADISIIHRKDSASTEARHIAGFFYIERGSLDWGACMSPSVAGARTSSKEDLRDDTAEDVLPCEPLLIARGAASLERRDALCEGFSMPFFAFLPSDAPKRIHKWSGSFCAEPVWYIIANSTIAMPCARKREMKAHLW